MSGRPWTTAELGIVRQWYGLEPVAGCGPSAAAVAMRLIPMLQELARPSGRRPLAV